MTKNYCDRCKKEIGMTEAGASNIMYLKTSLQFDEGGNVPRPIPTKEDLCGDCTKKVFIVLDKIKEAE